MAADNDNNVFPGNIDIDAVIEKYASTVYRIALTNMRSKTDADDIFQEVFLRCLKNKKPFASEEHLKAWLIRVTVNCCKTAYLSPWNDNVSLDDISELGSLDPEESGIYREILSLKPAYRNVLILFYYEDMSISSIAKALGTGEALVKMRLSRARKQLRLAVSENGGEKL